MLASQRCGMAAALCRRSVGPGVGAGAGNGGLVCLRVASCAASLSASAALDDRGGEGVGDGENIEEDALSLGEGGSGGISRGRSSCCVAGD